MKRCVYIGICLWLLLGAGSTAQTEGITVKAEVDHAVLTIGEPITYTVTVTYDPAYTLRSTILMPQIEEFSVLGSDYKEPRLNRDGLMETSRSVSLRTFMIGDYSIKGQTIRYANEINEERSIRVNDLFITVASVRGRGEKGLRDIKGVIAVGPQYNVVYGIILVTLIVLLVGKVLWRRFGDRINAAKRGTDKIILTPNEQALRELHELHNSNIVRDGNHKVYYSRVAEIIKHYLARIYSLETYERTTSELRTALCHIDMRPADQELVMALLTTCDMVKFAKYKPTLGELQDSHDLAKNTIQNVQEYLDQRKQDAALDQKI